MKKYTYSDWLRGIDNVKAEKGNFNLEEWAKVESKRHEICEKINHTKYYELLKQYERELEESTSEENYRAAWIVELKYAIEETSILGKPISPELEALKEEFAMLDQYNGLSIDMPYPEYPDTTEAQNAAKAKAYTKLYKYLCDQQNVEDSEIDPKQKGLTTKQQILLIHYLQKIGAVSLNKIHQDETVQALVLGNLLSRDISNIRKYLNQISDKRYRSFYFTKDNLTAILPIIEGIGNQDIVDKISSEINLIK